MSIVPVQNLEAFSLNSDKRVPFNKSLRKNELNERVGAMHAKLLYQYICLYTIQHPICAFWTVTKWCFIACCIDDANYLTAPQNHFWNKMEKEKMDKKKNISVIKCC